MSLPFKTGIEEYARQCTAQRRRYEDCLQKTRQDKGSSEIAPSWTIAQTIAVREAALTQHLDRCTEETMQSCMIDLLELPVDPLAWEGSNPVLDETRTTALDADQWEDDSSSAPHQPVPNQTGDCSYSRSYGAP